MKAFLFSIFALALLVSIILVNAAYVGRVTDTMQLALQDLPQCSQAKEKADALLTLWEKEETHLALSVSATDMNDVENHLIALHAAVRLNDEEAFERSRALCLVTVARIHDLERFRFLHIL